MFLNVVYVILAGAPHHRSYHVFGPRLMGGVVRSLTTI